MEFPLPRFKLGRLVAGVVRSIAIWRIVEYAIYVGMHRDECVAPKDSPAFVLNVQVFCSLK